jgi:hypothetical protein
VLIDSSVYVFYQNNTWTNESKANDNNSSRKDKSKVAVAERLDKDAGGAR